MAPKTKKPAAKKTAKPKKEGAKTRRKKRVESYSSYIYKVLKQVHPDTGISNRGHQGRDQVHVQLCLNPLGQCKPTLVSFDTITLLNLIVTSVFAKV